MTWTATVVEADGTPVTTLELADGGSVHMSLAEGATSPHRLTLPLLGNLPDMRGRFIVDKWAGDDGPGEWWLPLPAAPESLAESDYSRQLSAIDLTGLLARTKLTREEICPAGRFVDGWVDDMLTTYAAAHRARFHVVDIDTTLRAELAFAPGTSLLSVTADPLLAAAMTAWTPLAGGQVESVPWLPPAQRPTVLGFGDDTAPDASPFYDGWGRDRHNAAPSANEILANIRESGDLPALVGRWADEADILRHGAITELVPGTVEAVDQAAADLIAARHADTIRPRTEITFPAPWQPIRPGQVCRVTWRRWGIDGLYELTEKRTDRGDAADTTYTMRSV